MAHDHCCVNFCSNDKQNKSGGNLFSSTSFELFIEIRMSCRLSAVAFIPKLFLRVYAPIFTHLLFLILINIVTIVIAPKILFHVILWESQSVLCAKNVTSSANKFYIAALNFSKSDQLFKYNPFVPKFRMPILNFLNICTKLMPKNLTNLSALKLLALHRLKPQNTSYHSRKFTTFRFRKISSQQGLKFCSHITKNRRIFS